MPVKCRLRHDGTTLPVSGSATQVDKHGVFLVDQPGRHDLSKADFHAATDAALRYHTIDLTACTCSVPTPTSGEDNYNLFANSCAPATVCTTCNKGLDECQGHFGHIRLVLPIFHIGYINHTY